MNFLIGCCEEQQKAAEENCPLTHAGIKLIWFTDNGSDFTDHIPKSVVLINN